jgi:hypothetical protein
MLRRGLICAMAGIGLVAALLALQLGLLALRMGHWPNYAIWHDWLGSLATIWHSTPSLRDIPAIVADEWLLEVGYMNYGFGRGISEWSVVLVPAKALAVFAIGALAALGLQTTRDCPWMARGTGAAAIGSGVALAGLANITMTWVVCCAAPTWVVGLAILGLGISTSLSLVPLGPWLQIAGFALLLVVPLLLRRRPQAAAVPHREVACLPTS